MRTPILLSLTLLSCQPSPEGEPGPTGPPGPMGAMGAAGRDGAGPDGTGTSARSGTRIRFQWVVTTRTTTTEDGAALEAVAVSERQFYDSKLDTPCAMGLAEDGVARCLPTGPTASLFEDAACSKPIAYQGKYQSPCGEPPPPPTPVRKYWRVQPLPRRNQCDPVLGDKIRALGAEIPPPTAFYSYQGTPDCKPLSAGDDAQIRAQVLRYYSTSAVMPSDLVRMSQQTQSVTMP